MGSQAREGLDHAEVYRNYRSAFDDFANRVRQARELMAASNPDRRAIDAALLDLEKARTTYNRHREVLARQLLHSELPESIQSLSNRVKAIAELRWELAGKPDGNADDDWYRAEEIVRLATAA